MEAEGREPSVLLVFAHPALERSRANAVLAEARKQAAGAAVADAVERETFEGVLAVGVAALKALASRDAAQTMDRLLAADLAEMQPGAADGWDTKGRDEEQRETAGQDGPARPA